MARGGINKALMQDTCAVRAAGGQHANIDMARVQLGNTGTRVRHCASN